MACVLSRPVFYYELKPCSFHTAKSETISGKSFQRLMVMAAYALRAPCTGEWPPWPPGARTVTISYYALKGCNILFFYYDTGFGIGPRTDHERKDGCYRSLSSVAYMLIFPRHTRLQTTAIE